MEILLKKDVANLGYAGEIVKVKAGYAVNYLVPQGFATVATESVKKQHAETLRQRAHKEAKLVADAEALAAKLAEALQAAGLDIDKKNITIPSDIKELGTYEAAVKIYKGIKGAFKFEVVSE